MKTTPLLLLVSYTILPAWGFQCQRTPDKWCANGISPKCNKKHDSMYYCERPMDWTYYGSSGNAMSWSDKHAGPNSDWCCIGRGYYQKCNTR
ncbi:unnamed protein product [Cercospora beticola]|nr:unnamed protein product [Cercospora beticola]